MIQRHGFQMYAPVEIDEKDIINDFYKKLQ